jgi:hypothetical protein
VPKYDAGFIFLKENFLSYIEKSPLLLNNWNKQPILFIKIFIGKKY